jgi:hypothetical protein
MIQGAEDAVRTKQMALHSGETGWAAWAVAVTGGGLYALQSASADASWLTLRYAASAGLTAGAILALARIQRRNGRGERGPTPDPATLALAGVTALCLWAVAWWLMDWTNHLLTRRAGPLATPTPITALDDRLLSFDLGALTYELGVLSAVVLLPLAQGWMVWGLLQPEIEARTGPRRAVAIAGGAGGTLLALSAVQNVAPALPWGLASWPGYTLIALAASLLVALTRSPWPGIIAYAVYAYASLAWRADLLRQFGGLDYWDPKWLTAVVLGGLGAGVCLQVIRYRVERPSSAPPSRRRPFRWWDWLALALLAVALLVMAFRDVEGRRAGAGDAAAPVSLQPPHE